MSARNSRVCRVQSECTVAIIPQVKQAQTPQEGVSITARNEIHSRWIVLRLSLIKHYTLHRRSDQHMNSSNDGEIRIEVKEGDS